MWLELICAIMTMKFQLLNNGIANFNIMNDAKVTTYPNDGFYTMFKVDSEEKTVLENGEITLNGCYLKTKLEYWQDKEYVRITYTVKNFVDKDKKIGISTYSDIQIDTNDKAPVSNMNKNRGFKMSDGKLAIEVFARNTYGVTDVDAYWYGNMRTIYNNVWSSGTESSSTYYDLNNVDSAMSLSWKNRILKPGETQEFSFLIGFGEYFNKPELNVYTVPARSYYGTDTIKLAGYMTHTDAPRTGRCIIQLDFANNKIAFENADIGRKYYYWEANYPIPPNLKSGSHTISICGIDNKNQATEAFYYVFTYTPAPTPAPPITPYDTPFLTAVLTPVITPFSTAQLTEHETAMSTPFETAYHTQQETPFNTAFKTVHETPMFTPFSTIIYTEIETPITTPFETAYHTPFETVYHTPFETPLNTVFQTEHETPFNTEHETPFLTAVSTAYETPYNTPIETPFSTAFETENETPFITPHETNKVPPIVPITENPSNEINNNESTLDANVTNENQDINGNNFRIITSNKWVVIVIVAIIIILALIAILALIIFMISKTYREITTDSDDFDNQVIDIEELSAEDSGETVDISDCDVEQADFFISTIQE